MAEAKQVDFLLAGLRDPGTDEFLSGGKVYTYAAGTSTPANLYVSRDTDDGFATNPILLNAYGQAEVFGNGVYKFVVTTADDVSVFEVDGLEYKPAISDSALPALSANLDFNGYKGINLVPGSSAGDTVEFAQFDDAITAVESDIADIEADLAGLAFVELTDTPATLAGQAYKVPSVNAAGTALELLSVTQMLSTGSLLGLTDTPADYTGQTGKALVVNAGANAVEFAYPDAKTIQGVTVSATAPTTGQVLALTAGGIYEPTTPAAAPTLKTLTPGTGLSGTAYDGSADQTWTVSGVGGVTLAEAAAATYTAAPGKKILVATGYQSNGRAATFIIPAATINSGQLSTGIAQSGSTYYYMNCLYTSGSGNSVTLSSSEGAIVHVAVLLGDA
jgi:hypothetical protein